MDMETYLPLTISPKIHPQRNSIIDRRVRSLIQQRRRQRRHRQHHQARLDAAVHRRAGQDTQRPLPGEHEDAEDKVDDLQDREGLHGPVEVLG